MSSCSCCGVSERYFWCCKRVGCAPPIRSLKVDLGTVSYLAAPQTPLVEASEIALEILNSRSMINEAILKIWIFLMHNWQNKVHASSIAVVVLRLSQNGRCGGVGGVVVRYVSWQCNDGSVGVSGRVAIHDDLPPK